MELASGKVAELAATKAAEEQPHYSPDGRYLEFDKSSDPPHWPGESRIALLTRATGEVRLLPATADEKPAVVGWTADSKSVLYQEFKGTRQAIYAMPIDGPGSRRFTSRRMGVATLAELNSTGTHLAFSYENASTPPEAFLLPVSETEPARVSRANDSVPKLPIGETKKVIH